MSSIIFTVRLHVMQRTVLRRPFCLSICPSVPPSVRPSILDNLHHTDTWLVWLQRMVGQW